MVNAQIKYEWDYLYGALEVTGGQAHFCHLPQVNLEYDDLYLADLAATDPEAVHILIRDQAGFHLRDGDPRLPANVRIVDLLPYSPELNPCEQLLGHDQGRAGKPRAAHRRVAAQGSVAGAQGVVGEAGAGALLGRTRMAPVPSKHFTQNLAVS